MESDFTSYSIIGIACCGIIYADENLRNCVQKAQECANNYQYGELEFPLFNMTVDVKVVLGTSCYSIKVAPFSSNVFAIISGDAYSVFRVTDKSKNHLQLQWRGQAYSAVMAKESNSFKWTINQSNIVYLETRDDSNPQQSCFKFLNFPNVQEEDLTSDLETCLSELTNVLSGYVLPEPLFSKMIRVQLERIFTILLDPLLPAIQFQRFLDNVGASLTIGLVTDLQQVMGQYTSNFSSLFSRFPSTKIKSTVEKYLESIEDNSLRLNMAVTVRPVLELAEMYSDGVRGNAKFVIEKLLIDYLRVEIKFQDDETISSASVTNKLITVADLISHNSLTEKNKLVLTLFEILEKFLPGIILDLKGIIQKLLKHLSGSAYSQLIPKLREVLITGQIPSYEVRINEMESIFLNSINGYSNCVHTSRLENLICSNSEVFDIISYFFYHKKIEIRRCAMEVYVRRAYMVYEICSFEQAQLADGQLCVFFKFSLPTNNRSRNLTGHEIKRSNSYVALANSKAALTRKFSQTCRNALSNGYVENEDGSYGDLSTEYEFRLNINRQRSNDYETDSAISVGARSLSELSATVSEQVDSDCVLDATSIKAQHSPSIHSLDRFWAPSNFSISRDTSDNIDTLNLSLDKLALYKPDRTVSTFFPNPPMLQMQDLSLQIDLGVMIIFDSLDDIERGLPSIRDLLSLRNSVTDEMDFLDYDMSTLDRNCTPIYKVILKLILRDSKLTNMFDDEVATVFFNFCDEHISFFDDIRVVQITFLLQSLDKTIRYFTFRYRGRFEEDMKLRNIDPILSFQLEINRLRNYHLERLPVPNGRMYVYMGKCKDVPIGAAAEYRMFTRCIIHHKDFNISTSNVEYMAKEAERNLIEAMDAFDMAWVDDRASLTKLNHIFFYFHSILCVTKIDELENVVRAIIFKYGRRLWSLRITQAELKMSVKVSNMAPVPIRLWVHNEGGKCLDVCIYREEFQFKTEKKVLISWSATKEGRYHGVPVDCFYSS